MTHAIENEISWRDSATAVPVPGPYLSGAWFYLSSLLYCVPLTCFAGAVLADLAYVQNPDIQWSNFSSWLLAFGAAFLAVAILVSIARFLVSLGRRRSSANWLFGLFVVASAVTALFDNFIHSHDGWTAVWPTGLILSAMALFFLVVATLLKVASLSNTYMVEAQ